MHSSELLKGTLQTIILKVLLDNGKMYGYEITQKVKELSDSTIRLTEGALYPALHRMEAEGLLKTESVLLENAILIACLGLFALTAFTAEQRTKGIGSACLVCR